MSLESGMKDITVPVTFGLSTSLKLPTFGVLILNWPLAHTGWLSALRLILKVLCPASQFETLKWSSSTVGAGSGKVK